MRVPTHQDGNCLFWEFATDNYDIGFGVFFEWTVAESNQVFRFFHALLIRILISVQLFFILIVTGVNPHI